MCNLAIYILNNYDQTAKQDHRLLDNIERVSHIHWVTDELITRFNKEAQRLPTYLTGSLILERSPLDIIEEFIEEMLDYIYKSKEEHKYIFQSCKEIADDIMLLFL